MKKEKFKIGDVIWVNTILPYFVTKWTKVKVVPSPEWDASNDIWVTPINKCNIAGDWKEGVRFCMSEWNFEWKHAES